jgi:hypothetical protein
MHHTLTRLALVVSFLGLSSLAHADELPPPSAIGSAPPSNSSPSTSSPSTGGDDGGRAAEAPKPTPRPSAARAAAAPSAPTDPEEYRPPTVVDYYGGRIPRDSVIETRPRYALLATGIAMTGGAYFISLTYALSTCGAKMECRSGSEWLYAPIIGPFMAAAKAPTTGGMALATFDGFVQVGGLALAAASLLSQKKVVVTYGKPSIEVTPMAVAGGSGVGITLTHM